MAVRLSAQTLRQNADINVTPFVDVMLVLLIIFMVSLPLATSAIKVDLPEGIPLAGKPTYLSLQQDGRLILVADGAQRQTNLSALGDDLARVLPRDRSILIRADRHVRYAAFMAVVNRLQTEGFYNVSLISEAEPGTT
jgi:biopolymer transport protein ExbD